MGASTGGSSTRSASDSNASNGSTGGGQEKDTECRWGCKKKEGVLKEVKQEARGGKNAIYVVLWLQSDASNTKNRAGL